MTFAEILLALLIGVIAYKILLPVRRMIESFLLRAFGGRKKPDIHVIDADWKPQDPRDKE